MSALYLAALCALSLVMLALVFEALWSVARPPQWHAARRPADAGPIERRTQNLPFVGTERRVEPAAAVTGQPSVVAPEEVAEVHAKAA